MINKIAFQSKVDHPRASIQLHSCDLLLDDNAHNFNKLNTQVHGRL